MHKIPDTFCPAKWDELFVSFEMNYAYSCCKSTPTKFSNNVFEIIDVQKQKLLEGHQDESCNYCWNVERLGTDSLRHSYLKDFDPATFEQYKDNSVRPRMIQVSLGNECNFQCTYCNPKFSSKWEQDVRTKPYKVFTDRFFYSIDPKQSDVMDKNIEFLSTISHIEKLGVQGGEHHVARERGVDGDFGRLQVADFAHHHDIRRLPEHRAQGRGKRHAYIVPDRHLINAVELVQIGRAHV